jgi:hypothetical protein
VTVPTNVLLGEKQSGGYENNMANSLYTNVLHLIEAKHQYFLKCLVCSVDILHVYFSDECKVDVSGLINKQSSRWDTELPLQMTNSMPLNPGEPFGVW